MTSQTTSGNPKTTKSTNQTGGTPQTLNQSGAAATQDMLKVTINASRASVTRGGSYGVYADLENLSPSVVTIKPQETVLVVQPEVAQPSACVGLEQAIFPARPSILGQLPTPSTPQPSPSTPGQPSHAAQSLPQTAPQAAAPVLPTGGSSVGELQIQSGEHYKVFWNLTSPPGKRLGPNCSGTSWMKDYLGFVPGDYAFTVEGIVYSGVIGGVTTAHTYTETTTLHVGISQIPTAIAAFFGGLLAYFVVALQPGQDFAQWVPKAADATSSATLHRVKAAERILRNSFAAGLLGAALTIVASRLSETQFPVKVSVNDFWGALTIGFVSYFVGHRIIASIATRFASAPNL